MTFYKNIRLLPLLLPTQSHVVTRIVKVECLLHLLRRFHRCDSFLSRRDREASSVHVARRVCRDSQECSQLGTSKYLEWQQQLETQWHFLSLLTKSVPATASREIISFIRLVDKITSSKTGTLPPTNPVLPPCGQTANRLSLQCFNTSATSLVVFGKTTTLLSPGWTAKIKISFRFWYGLSIDTSDSSHPIDIETWQLINIVNNSRRWANASEKI